MKPYLLFILLVIPVVLAAEMDCGLYTSTCPGTVLLRLANQSANYTNAHAQLANYTTPYSHVLCCNSSNEVGNLSTGEVFLELSGQTNAHAQVNGTYPYQAYISSAIGAPTCSNYTTCPSDYTCLISISSYTNAHIGPCVNGYPTLICCQLTELYLQVAILNFDKTSPQVNGTYINASCNGDLFREGINVTLSENNNLTRLPVGTHNYSCQLQANSTHSYDDDNRTFVIYLPTVTPPSSGGGGGTTTPTTCTYYFSQPQYYSGDEVTLTIVCPTTDTTFSYEWRQGDTQAVQPIILFYNTSTLSGNTANLTYMPTKTGYVQVNINGQLINAPYVILPAISKEIEYWYMFMLMVGFITIIYLLNKYMQFEQSRDGSFTLSTTEKTFLIIEAALFSVTSYLYLQKTEQLGYLYMAGVGLVLLAILYLFNRAVTMPKTRISITEKIAGAVIIITAGVVTFLYLQKTNKEGYVYMVLLGGLMLIILMILNKLIQGGKRGTG